MQIKNRLSLAPLVLMALLIPVWPASSQAIVSKPVVIKSPDGNIRLLLEVKNGTLAYSVYFGNIKVISPSAMGLVINGKWSGKLAQIGKIQKYTIDETYGINGGHSTAVNHCNGEKISVNSSIQNFVIDTRVYNDGVAFRYLVSNQGSSVVNQDSTQFNIADGAMVWSQPNIKYYEGRYTKKSIKDFKAGELAGPPLTLELANDAGYAAITEAGLVDFAGMSLIANGNSGFTANLTGVTNKVGTIESPWRVIEVGRDLNTLVNCDLITNLSPAFNSKLFPQGNKTSWVKPGRSVWSWLAQKSDITLENMKHFSDMAAQLGFEYNLVDEGWGNWKDGSRDKWDMMKELVDYSAKKGVKIWVWKAYPDRNGIPGINTEEKRRAFFKRCADLGIAGLKVDFFDSESQEIVDFYQAALKDAAEYKLMMDFHGANKPTGENRTWPNELTREAIRGLENQPPWAPGNSTLPFTRFLAGPADYTPVHFGSRLGDVTWAHMVATMVIFTSPLMCLGADPQSILDNPCKEMIKSIPPTWDETIVLPESKIGELAVFARRQGNTWFLAGVNGLKESKTLKVELTFLKKGRYELSVIKDSPETQRKVLLENKQLTEKETIDLTMNGGGGFVIKIDKITKH